MTKMILKITGLIIALLIIGVIIIAKSKGVLPLGWHMHKTVSQTNQIAIQGFDPISYFAEAKAEKGSQEYAFEWNKVNWYFTTSEHRDEFIANPDRYTPQFGGYCSFAVSKGFTASPDPTAWHIQNDRLYLFADGGMKKNWLEQLPEVVSICEQKWQ